jgi:hypothetical protein
MVGLQAVRDRHLTTALRSPGFRQLLAVRLTCQFGDGLFQASLAGAVLFDPERQARAADIAAGFTVLLLPYSLIGGSGRSWRRTGCAPWRCSASPPRSPVGSPACRSTSRRW